MQFKITRTSDHVPPCPEATRLDDDWIVQIETIEDLMAFVVRHDTDIIVHKGIDGPIPVASIEIYDDYRE